MNLSASRLGQNVAIGPAPAPLPQAAATGPGSYFEQAFRGQRRPRVSYAKYVWPSTCTQGGGSVGTIHQFAQDGSVKTTMFCNGGDYTGVEVRPQPHVSLGEAAPSPSPAATIGKLLAGLAVLGLFAYALPQPRGERS